MSRRAALRLLGAGAAGAGCGLAAAGRTAAGAASAAVQEPAASGVEFPAGAVVRTVLADVDPEVLGTGATLFHEHLAFDYASPPAEPRAPGSPVPAPPTNAAMVDLLVEEIDMAGFDGVSCIVDSGTGPRTAQQLEKPHRHGDALRRAHRAGRQLHPGPALSRGDHPPSRRTRSPRT